jgi:hypothetical protein
VSADEPVGTVAEEAAKLIAALSGWAGDREPGREPAPDGDGAAEVGGVQRTATEGGAGRCACGGVPRECRWCPVCSAAKLASATSPEVRAHLSQAALSLAQAVTALLQDTSAAGSATVPVEKIDLAEE